MTTRVVIDTDAGIDDALALMLALKSPELRVEAITTVSGNAHVDLCTENVLRVLEILELDSSPLVIKGEPQPLRKTLFTAPEVHGADGFGGLHSLMEETGVYRYAKPSLEAQPGPASSMLPQIAQREPGEITLIAIGPLTNVAKGFLKNSAGMKAFREIILMGGAFEVRGNTTPVAEFNMFVDPDAASIVLESGVPVTIVPLDVTQRVYITEEDVKVRISPLGNTSARFVSDILRGYIEYHAQTEEFRACYLHDPLTVGLAVDPSLCRLEERFVSVLTQGEQAGQTVWETALPKQMSSRKTRVAVEVDAQRFMSLLMEKIVG